MVLKNKWKKRSLYGNQLLTKIKKISKLLNTEIEKEIPDVVTIGHYCKMYGYLVQVQLSNISKVEEFDMSEIMDRYNEHKERIQEVSTGHNNATGIIATR